MKKILSTLLLSAATMGSAWAGTPLWMRDVRISPDGTEIAFCYKGDIFKVDARGGKAQRIAGGTSYECSPVWSPDGKQIAFASDRYGSMDVFIVSAQGGLPTRLTDSSESETPTSFTADGKRVLFNAALQDPASSALFPSSRMTELYSVATTGGRIEQVLATPAEMISLLPGADGSFLYQDRKGGEDEWRKHHTSSITRDIWLYDAATGRHTNLTNRPGEDRNPVVSPNGTEFYFLSERDTKSFNVYRMGLNNPQAVLPVTNFKTHPVRFLSLGGGTLCYTYDGEIYTQTLDGKPAKVRIDLTDDFAELPERFNFTSGATSATVSPDGKQVAFIIRGEVFVTSADYTTTKQITHTPAAEKYVCFGPDNRTLAYASERDGIWQLYLAKIVRDEDPNFANATLVEEEVLLPSKTVERSMPQFSPDGKELAFIEDRFKLKVVNLETKKVRQVTDGSTWFSTSGGFDYQWSPDGKWFALEFVGNRHDPYTDIGLVSADGKGSIVNLTNSGYTSGSPRWVMDGNALLFTTERYGMRSHASWGSLDDVMMVFLNQEAYDKYRLSKEDYELLKEEEKEADKADKDSKEKKDEAKEKKQKDIVVELKGIEDRIVRLTPNSSNLGDAILSADGEHLYYMSSFEKGYDLWKMDLRKHETKLLNKMNAGYASLQMDKKGKTMFILSGRSMQKLNTSNDKLESISYRAEMTMDLAAERAYMFDHVYRQEQKRFYNLNMHGVDWDAMTAAYRKFLPHINNNYDFAELLSELLGELNVSHTGGRYYPDKADEPTASLGLLYSWSHKGEGALVDEVVEKGPFDNDKTQMQAGCIIEKIDGQPISANTNLSSLLNGKQGKKTLISFYNPATGQRYDEVVKPISSGSLNGLLYQRWVKQRAADVERWSGGRLGYVHIKSMDDSSFRNIYSDILGKYNKCEGIVIDTRFNGGGRLHEDVEVLFSGKKYFTQVVRGREACDMPSRRWNKPSIMLQCEANYSNAHGTPWVYKHRQLGKLVGAPVPGTMTSVSWETLQDRSLVFGIPVVGYRLPDGSYLENSQLDPDILVLNAPETIVKGEDTQLKTAVDELLKEIDKK